MPYKVTDQVQFSMDYMREILALVKKNFVLAPVKKISRFPSSLFFFFFFFFFLEQPFNDNNPTR